MKTIDELLELLPEEHRDDARKLWDNEAKRLGYDRRQAERMERELAKAQARVTELEQSSGAEALSEATAKVKALEADLKLITQERDGLLPLRAEHEARRLSELVNGKVKLADPAYLDHVVKVTGVKLISEVKDGQTSYTLNPEGVAALEAWAANEENAHRIARGNGQPSPYRPSAPPTQNAPASLSDPLLQNRFAHMPPKSQERVLQRLRELQS